LAFPSDSFCFLYLLSHYETSVTYQELEADRVRLYVVRIVRRNAREILEFHALLLAQHMSKRTHPCHTVSNITRPQTWRVNSNDQWHCDRMGEGTCPLYFELSENPVIVNKNFHPKCKIWGWQLPL